VSSTVRISCLQFIRCLCSHITLLDQCLSATYRVDLYSHLIGQLRQRHSSVGSDASVLFSAGQTHRTDAVLNNDIVVMEMTLAAVISVFDVDKFNSCLRELLDDMVRYN